MSLHNVALLTIFLTSSLAEHAVPAQQRSESASGREARAAVPFSCVRLGGELGSRYMAATCNLLTRTDRYTLESFACSATGKPGALWWDWPGDQVGRWFSVLHVAEGYGWTWAAWHRRAISDVILSHQDSEGHFGPAGSAGSKDARIPSGNAFALRGLMDAYADTGDRRYLEAARRMARYFESIAPQWETRSKGKLHEFYGHCIDGLVALHEQGGDRWALELAERLAGHAGRTGHTHHSLSLCRGLIDLARATGRRECLEKVEDYLAWCRDNRTVGGGLPEGMPASEQDEGCGLADWIVVNLMMYQATGEDRYVADAEHTLVNHFFMNQFHTGGFGHRTFSQEIVGGKNWQGWDGRFGSENPGCCSLWGQWALGQVGRFIVTRSAEALHVNLYPTADVVLPEEGVRLSMVSDFPRMSRVRIEVTCQKPRAFALHLRVPPWAAIMKVTCDGNVLESPPGGGRVVLSRTWDSRAGVDIEFVSQLRAVPWPAASPAGVALFDGPLCLGLSGASADVALAWRVQVDAIGRLVLDDDPAKLKEPKVADPAGHRAPRLEPICARWLIPEVKDPARWRILFQTLQPEGSHEGG